MGTWRGGCGVRRQDVVPVGGSFWREHRLHVGTMQQGIGKIAPEWADWGRATGGTSRWPRRESGRGAQISGRQ